MSKEIKNYIAQKIFSIAYIIMPKSEIKANLSIWYIQTYGGKK